MKIVIDEQRCMGNGVCASVLPAVFGVTDEGVAELLAEPDDATWDVVREAERLCPTQAISIEP